MWRKFVLGVFVFILMVGFAGYVNSYNMIMNEDGTDNVVLTYRISNLYSGLNWYDYNYFGYLGDNHTGYYLGTVIGENTGPHAFNNIVDYYLGYENEMVSTKVDVENMSTSNHSFKNDMLEIDTLHNTWLMKDGYTLGFYAIKGGNDFALYYVDPFESLGIWTTEHLLVGNGNNPDISHMSAMATPVPEPATILLLGCGLLGLATTTRRKVFK